MPGNPSDRGHTPNTGPEAASTLLPMLIAGLVLIVVGAIIVMNFV